MQQFRRAEKQLCLAVMIGVCLEVHAVTFCQPGPTIDRSPSGASCGPEPLGLP
jgi:hypothetical protein